MSPLTRRDLLALGRDLGVGMAASALLPLAGCRHNIQASSPSMVMAPEMNPLDDGSLKAHAFNAGILSGAAIDVHALRGDARYRALVIEQCNIIVSENVLKWDALRPSADMYDFSDSDFMVDFAEQNSIKMRGHALVWHLALPKWFDASVFKGDAKEMMVNHISTVVGRYAGRMHSWDVVNEAVNPDDQRLDGLRKSPWLDMIGEDYIEIAFRAARQADPNTLLTYNEYGIELDNYQHDQKRAQTLLLLRRLKARNVPVDAVGIQSHLPAEPLTGTSQSYSGVGQFIDEVRALGMQVFITEMDVSDSALNADQHARNRAVAQTYRDYLERVLSDQATKAVLTWGMSGRHSWLNDAQPRADKQPLQPLPFDREYRVLPAFYAMRDAYDGRKDSLANPPDATTNPYAPFTPHPVADVPDKLPSGAPVVVTSTPTPMPKQ